MDDLFQAEKGILLRDIARSRQDIQLFERCRQKFGKQWQETIDLEKEFLSFTLAELVKLKRRGLYEQSGNLRESN